MTGTARSPGTCGELVQGSLDGLDFLVTCPVDMYSEVTVTRNTAEGRVAAPSAFGKTARAVELTFRRLGLAGGARVRVKSPIPRGKGMASSTADVSAACLAAARTAGRGLDPAEIAAIAISIEPTDGLMFQGIALFDHRGGRAWELLGDPPPMELLVVDPGGTVDTGWFNSMPALSELNRKKEPQVREALELVRAGLRRGDPSLIGQGATLSALAHQLVLEKPLLDTLIRLARRVGAVGVNVAHSGNVMGVIFDPRKLPAREAIGYISERLAPARVWPCRVIGGGVD